MRFKFVQKNCIHEELPAEFSYFYQGKDYEDYDALVKEHPEVKNISSIIHEDFIDTSPIDFMTKEEREFKFYDYLIKRFPKVKNFYQKAIGWNHYDELGNVVKLTSSAEVSPYVIYFYDIRFNDSRDDFIEYRIEYLGKSYSNISDLPQKVINNITNLVLGNKMSLEDGTLANEIIKKSLKNICFSTMVSSRIMGYRGMAIYPHDHDLPWKTIVYRNLRRENTLTPLTGEELEYQMQYGLNHFGNLDEILKFIKDTNEIKNIILEDVPSRDLDLVKKMLSEKFSKARFIFYKVNSSYIRVNIEDLKF